MGRKKRSEAGQPIEVYCGACGQRQTLQGNAFVCALGHAGAPSVSAIEVPAGVEATSTALKEALQEGAEQDALKEAREHATRWGSANAATEAPVDPEFLAIVECIVVDHPKATYDRLEKALRVGEKRVDYGTMMRELDEAESNARMAHRLWQTAIIERKRWELENEVVFAAMRTEANHSLQGEKDKGIRSKQITDADIESRVSALYPGEYKAQEMRRIKLKVMVDSMGNLVEEWNSRCRTLQTMLAKQR